MREQKNLAEWLEGIGNPKYAIAEGDNGTMVLAVENKGTFNPGIIVYSYFETELPNGDKHFWIGSGSGIRKEYLPVIKELIQNMGDETCRTRKGA